MVNNIEDKKIPTYKEFGKYLRTIANLYAKYGDAELEEEQEYDELYTKLCQLHMDFDHGANRILDLKDEFIFQCKCCGEGWFDPQKREIEE